MAGGVGAAPKLSEEATHHLQQGIAMLLSRWSALQKAVNEEWGGRQTRQIADQLALDIFSWFTHSKAMLSLNTEIEDGSIEEVAEKLMIMHEECLEGNYESIEKLREASCQPAVHHIPQPANEDDEGDDDNGVDDDGDESLNMIVDAPEALEPKASTAAEGDDGWVVVSSKRNKRKWN